MCDDVGGFTLDSEDLGGMRKIDIAGQLSAGPNAADFQAAVALLRRGV